jgi:hypothetical protein
MANETTVTFPRLNQFWNDSGVVGLYRIICGAVHAPTSAEGDIADGTPLGELHGVQEELNAERLALRGSQTAISELLADAHYRLVQRYYNVTTKNQLEKKATWNVFYDRKRDRFEKSPRKTIAGIARLFYKENQVIRPLGKSLKWGNGPDGKKRAGVLPEELAPLQSRYDNYLKAENLKPGPPAGFLVDGPNAVQIPIKPKPRFREGSATGRCFLCGQSASARVTISQAIYPLTTGPAGILSFYEFGEKPTQVCWKCSYVAKFVPVSAFFMRTGNKLSDLHAFLPFAPSLTKMNQVYEPLMRAAEFEPNWYRNFETSLGGYFTHSTETCLAFLHTVYRKTLRHSEETLSEADTFLQELYGLVQEEAPVSFAVVSATSKGNTMMVTDAWLFDDVAYLFRLFDRADREGINLARVAKDLVDHDAKAENRTLDRTRMFRNILNQQPIIFDVSAWVGRKGNTGFDLNKFTRLYECIRHKEEPMYAEMVETAASLGKQIGLALAGKVRSKDEHEGRAKGSLFRLRKARTMAEFVNEIPRLQHRYGLSVKKELYEGALTPGNFEEFRGFCLIAAFNAFHAGLSNKTDQGGSGQ